MDGDELRFHSHWGCIMKMVRWAELMFEAYAPPDVLDHIHIASRDIVPFKTMHPPNFTSTSKWLPPAKYFGAIASGCNVYLRCHTNDDFTMSMVHILLKGGIVTILTMMLLHISVSHHWEWLFQ